MIFGWQGLPSPVSLKALDKELYRLVTVSAVGKTGVGKEADHSLVDLNAARRVFRAVCAETAPLLPCADIVPGPLRDNKPKQGRELKALVLWSGFRPYKGQEGYFSVNVQLPYQVGYP